MRPYTRKRPFVPRPQNLPDPESARSNHVAAVAMAQQSRNLEILGDISPAALPDCPNIPGYKPAEPGDLLLLPQFSRARLLLFLEKFAVCKRFNLAMTQAGVQYWEITQGKRASQSYADLYQAVRDSIIEGRVADIESAIAADAAGEEPEPGRRRPDNRNAALFLAANDPRYRPQATSSGATVILDVHI